MREKDFGIWQEVTWAAYWDTVPDRRPRAAGARRRAGRPGRDPLREPPGVALRRRGHRRGPGDDGRPVPDQPAGRGRLPAVRTPARKVLDRRGPGAGRQGARGARPAARTWSGSSTSSRAASGTATTHPKLLSWDDLLALGRGAPGRAPGRGRASGWPTATAGRHRHADLHLGHDRPAQGRDAVGGQRGVRDRDAGRRRRVHLAAARAATTCMLSYLPLCHVAERIFTTWFNAGAGVQVNFAESIATVQAEPARGAADDPVRGAADLGEDPRRRARSGWPARRRLKRRQRPAVARAWPTGSAPRWCAPAAGTPPAPGCCTRSAGCSSSGRCGSGSACGGCGTPPRGAAPIAPEVLKFFMGIGVPMHEVYGMTENTAIATGNRPGRVKLGTVGEPQRRRRAAHRPGDRRDPHPAPGHVRRLLPRPGGHRRRR